MTAPRRVLLEEEVSAVFDSVFNGSTVPDDLQFHVIVVDPSGGKISPPRQNFHDGIYILCTDENQLPEHLLDKVNEGPPMSSSFRWHPANGTSRPSAFRMRNCYRFSNAGERISGVRGYLWTKLSSNDNESLQYRLLHVFPSNETIVERTIKSSRKDVNGKKIKEEKPRTKRRKMIASANGTDENRPHERNKRSRQDKTTRQASCMNIVPTTTLTEDDVRAVFESIHSNRKPPPHLTFQVIGVEAKSAKVTPPQLLYQDGLYVFCDLAKCPEHLGALARPHLASTTDFRWNVSGPRESASKAFVMRGCHGLPKTSGKSRDKCGVVYTKIVNGQEDFQYRLLHIYPNMLSALSRPRPVKKKQAQPVQQIQVAGCEVCGKDSHGDCLMECDGCKRQYCHTYCLGLTAVPQGEWYCKGCMPRKPLAVVQGNRMQSSKGRPLKKKSYSSNQQQHVGLMSGSNATSLSKSRSTEAGAVHYKIIACEKENASAENASRRDDQLGFIIMKKRNASFADLRAAVEEELDPESLPGSAWKFFVPSLGAITKKQEESLGPTVSFFEKAFKGRLGDGSVNNPYQLALLSS